MFSIRFSPRSDDPSWRPSSEITPLLTQLNADEFTFRRFMVDVALRDDLQGEIGLRTSGLPVVDFFLMLVQLKSDLMQFGTAVAETSQTQDTITASRKGDLVQLSYSFSPIVSTISMDEFDGLPRIALRAAQTLLHSTHEELAGNEYLAGLSGKV